MAIDEMLAIASKYEQDLDFGLINPDAPSISDPNLSSTQRLEARNSASAAFFITNIITTAISWYLAGGGIEQARHSYFSLIGKGVQSPTLDNIGSFLEASDEALTYAVDQLLETEFVIKYAKSPFTFKEPSQRLSLANLKNQKMEQIAPYLTKFSITQKEGIYSLFGGTEGLNALAYRLVCDSQAAKPVPA